jgi:hypothetical protein
MQRELIKKTKSAKHFTILTTIRQHYEFKVNFSSFFFYDLCKDGTIRFVFGLIFFYMYFYTNKYKF